MTKSKRQQYGLGSFVKKFTKPIKKIWKSPLGKMALIGGLGMIPWGTAGAGGAGMSTWGRLGGMFGKKNLLGQLVRNKEGGLSLGKMGLMGLMGAGATLPFMGGDDEEDIVEEGWERTPQSIANIKNMAKNRDKSLSYLPSSIYAQPGYYNMAQGGIAGLANGGNPAEAQAEQMLKMEYQKYRNQGGTMSYQDFKMKVLQQAQAQGQGPGAQGQPQMAQPQMAAQGGRIGYDMGKLVGTSKREQGLLALIKELMMQKEGEKVISPHSTGFARKYGGPKLAPMPERRPSEDFSGDPGINRDMGNWKKRLRERFIPEEEMAMYADGGRIGAEEGGLMNLGGMEKDYRAEGGFVPIGGKEKADDVPARLSKNEFVFTADAVRNAGGGDIDAGAEVMQNMMENLEQGGQISEESQGAQGMYNNMQQLQSRMA